MATNYIGEIRMVSWAVVPTGWALCNGQLLDTTTYSQLFNLISYTYGGSGTSFAVPDLRGRLPIGVGQGPGLTNVTLAEAGGAEEVTLSLDQIPSHTHTAAVVSGPGVSRSTDPAGRRWASQPSTANPPYGPAGSAVNMGTGALAETGGGQPHENMSPFLTVNFVIALAGLVPPRP